MDYNNNKIFARINFDLCITDFIFIQSINALKTLQVQEWNFIRHQCIDSFKFIIIIIIFN